MALEIAPAPTKAAPNKPSTHEAVGRNGASERSDKAAENGKADKTAGSDSFLALLMGLEEVAAPDTSLDSTASIENLPGETKDSNEDDAKKLHADGLLQIHDVTLGAQNADITVQTQVPLSERRPITMQANFSPRAEVSAESRMVAVGEAGVVAGRLRAPSLSEKSGPLGTQQLQSENSREPSLNVAELLAARDTKGIIPVGRPEISVAQSPSLLPTAASHDEGRKADNIFQAKQGPADNIILLSSGLSGAMSVGGPSDTGVSGQAAQFQSVVAQEVAYYVSQDVQSAEMKLEGVGGGPVEVRINMQGQEAQVVFRTNEQQTRDMLEGAAAQLKDMLQQQGVTLTGVFVGGSGAGEAGQQQERKFRQGPRSDVVSRVGTAEVRSGGLSSGGVGRTLDLFV